MQQLKILAKLHAIYKDLGYVQKDGKNSFHGYKYLSDSGLKTALHPLLEKNGVLFLPTVKDVEDIRAIETKAGKIETVTKVTIEYCYVDVESGENVAGTSVGYGVDSADKGVYKAFTGAVKYAHLQTFQIPSGDDPEADSTFEKDSAEAAQTKVRDEKVTKAKAANEARAAAGATPTETFKSVYERLEAYEPKKGDAKKESMVVLGRNGYESFKQVKAGSEDEKEIMTALRTIADAWKKTADLGLQPSDAQ